MQLRARTNTRLRGSCRSTRTIWCLTSSCEPSPARAPPSDVAGYSVAFRYCIGGRPLRATSVSAATRCCTAGTRRNTATKATAIECRLTVGRNARGVISTTIGSRLRRWLAGQKRYMIAESRHLLRTPATELARPGSPQTLDCGRPVLVFLYTLFAKGLIFDGWRGWLYVGSAHARRTAPLGAAGRSAQSRHRAAGTVYILGVNAFHGDAAACLVRDGTPIAAAEEERFRRIKHWAGFPERGDPLLPGRSGRSRSTDVDHVAVNQDARANLWRKIGYTLANRPDLALVLDRMTQQARARGRRRRSSHARFPGRRSAAKCIAVEHHLAHLASAFLVSPFDEAAVVSVDGFGDFASAAWGVGTGRDIDARRARVLPALARHLLPGDDPVPRFPALRRRVQGDGARALRRADVPAQMRRIVALQDDGGFRAEPGVLPAPPGEDRVRVGERRAQRRARCSRRRSAELLGPRARRPDEALDAAHRDIARSVQAMYEEAFFHLLEHAARAPSRSTRWRSPAAAR